MVTSSCFVVNMTDNLFQPYGLKLLLSNSETTLSAQQRGAHSTPTSLGVKLYF